MIRSIRLGILAAIGLLGCSRQTLPGDAPSPSSTAAPTDTTAPFSRVRLLEEKGEASAGVSLGDLDGDGTTDIVLAKGRHWPLHNRVLLGDGRGGFVAGDLGEAPDRTYSAALADLDQDGDLDIVVSNDSPDRKLIYHNDGKGRFLEAGTFGDPAWHTRYVTLADLDRDGFPDVVVANRRGRDALQPSFVCSNDGKGAFETCQALPTESATSIVVADLDGDEAPDLFVPHRDGGQSIVLWNDGRGQFDTSTPVGPAEVSYRIGASGDVDGDGQLDLVVIDETEEGGFVLPNVGPRQFGEPIRLPGERRTPYALAVTDLDADRRPDIVVGFVEAQGSVYFNRGQGSFEEVRWNDGAGVVYGMAFVDLDGDGWQDIIAARTDAPNGVWFGGPRR